jgi:hypothetical protein
MNQWELRDYTHVNFPEWQDPKGSSIPIAEVSILRAVGIGAARAQELADAINAEDDVDRALPHDAGLHQLIEGKRVA